MEQSNQKDKAKVFDGEICVGADVRKRQVAVDISVPLEALKAHMASLKPDATTITVRTNLTTDEANNLGVDLIGAAGGLRAIDLLVDRLVASDESGGEDEEFEIVQGPAR